MKQTPVEKLFHKLWDTTKDKFTWYAFLKEGKEIEKQNLMNAQMDMFHFLNNLEFGIQYLDKRDQAEEYCKQYYEQTYGGNK